jgi:hypothetical protein
VTSWDKDYGFGLPPGAALIVLIVVILAALMHS